MTSNYTNEQMEAVCEALSAFDMTAEHVANLAADLPREWAGYMLDLEPEPVTYDEYLRMKCDAEARMDEARKLKGMTR